MKVRIQFDFEFEEDLTYEEIKNRIYIIEGWSESEREAFLEMPGGFKQITLFRKFIENNK